PVRSSGLFGAGNGIAGELAASCLQSVTEPLELAIFEHVNEGGSTMLQRSGRSFALCVTIAAAWAPGRANAHKGGTPRNHAVYPLFGFTKTDGPFPTDFFTRADPTQNTCERVNLAKPEDCVANASECVELDLLNQLDGFSVRPRLSIPFHG